MHKKIKAIITGSLVVVVGVAAVMMGTPFAQATEGPDCDDNAIIRCGTYSLTELRDKYTGDVPEVFAHYGVSGAEVKGTTGTIKSGYVTKSGNVVVGGDVVATGAVTVGRVNMPGSSAVTIDGKTYYQRTPSVSFEQEQLEAYVFFDSNGVFSGAVIKSCGNPVKGNPEAQPSAVCKSITKNIIARNKFSFDATAEVQDGATISGYVFTVKNNTGTLVASKTVSTSATSANSGEITIDKAGDYTAQVTVKTSVGDKTSDTCTTTFTVQEEKTPTAACKSLTKNVISRNKFSFDATAEVSDGAKVTAYVFTVLDAKDAVAATKTVTTSELKANSGEMTFEPGTYVAKVVVKTSVGDKTSADCTVTFTVKPEDKPTVSIDKKVDGVERKLVGTDQVFTYEIRVTNTSNVDLKDAVVSDKQPTGVTFIKASSGTIKNGTWSVTIDLKAGEHRDFTITAKVPEYKAGDIDNTACVEAEQVNPDKPICDDATVYVKPPVVKMIWVCELKTKDIIKIKESDFDSTKHSEDLTKCKEAPKPDMIWVCELATKDIKLIKKSDFDSTKYSRELEDCREVIVMVPVCDPATGKIISVKKAEEGNYKPVDDEACKGHILTTKTEVKDLPSTGPAETLIGGLVGSSALGLGVTSYIRSRNAVRTALRK